MANNLYVDDVTIDDGSLLWRRIPPWHVVFDENLGRVRPSSAAFDDHPNGSPMSVLIAADVLSSGRTADSNRSPDLQWPRLPPDLQDHANKVLRGSR